ncbi:MAG TPA: GNAT family N-acetyltransferase [Geodermatophilus sp.]|nr:GNAT family N-acetyltransferase [Geodermatophilus sp.]
MHVTVIRPGELREAELDRWRDFQRATPALQNPFLAPEFSIAVGGLRPQARVAVIRDGSRLVGFFPFERRGPRYGVPIAAGLTDCQGLVHAAGLEWDPQELLAACRLDVWEFDRLVTGQRPLEPYERLRAPSPVIDLSEGAAALLARLRENSSRIAEKLPRQQRRLTKDVGPLRFEFGSRDHSALHRLMGWKSAQYQRTGRADRFAEPWIIRLLEDLQQVDGPSFSFVLSTLYAGDHPVAAHVALRNGAVMAGWFPAYDVDFAKYSPGMLHRLHLIEAAAAAGVRLIELGRGTKDSKELFKTGDLAVAEGAVVRSPLGRALYRVGRAPVRRLRQTVMDSPALYRCADRLLKSYGRARSALAPGSGEPPLSSRR